MTKLELTISASMDMDMDMEMDMHIDIVEYNDQTAQILGLPLPSPTPTTTPTAKPIPIPISEVLADSQQLRLLQQSIQKIARTSKSKSNNTTSSTATSSTATKAKSASTEQPHSSSISISSSFQTLNLVFLAPDPASTPESEQLLITADRSPLTGVFQSPMHAFHTAGHFHICCFTQLQQLQPLQQSQQPSRDNNDNATTITIIQLVALEYSREHRATLLQQEFESWLVDQIMEKAVIATTIDGTVVYWNRFATALYGYHKQEAMGQEIRDLISTNMSRQQGNEMMARMVEGEHFSTMYKAARKDGTDFMAHTTTTPILDGNNGQVQFMVGVSADYSQLHTVMNKLEQLNANLEKEVVARTEQLLAKEKRLRMIGAAMKQSDTGVIITNNQYNITWCNEAVSRMLGLRQQVILGMKPWELPLQKESKASGSNTHTNTNNNNNAAEDAISVASSQDSNAHARDSRQKTSSLETFFMQEKAYNEQENSNANANVRREDDDDSDDNDDAVNAILREVGASISFSRNNSQTNLTGMDSTTTDATTANTAAATATAMDNTCTTQTTNTTTTTTQPQTTPPEPRPSIPAVCFKLDSPVPLHIMIGVQAMPLDRTFLRLTPKKSASARSSSYSAADMQVLRAGAGGGAGAGVGVGVGIPPVQSTTSTSTSTSSTSQSTTRTRPKEQGHFSYYNDAAKEAAGAPETPSNITKPDNETSSSLKFMITLRDITAERKAEEAQLIAERASAANEAKTQMMQMLSHELRTPLQGIMGVASTSMMDIEDAEGTTNTGNNIIDNNSNDHQALSSPTSSGKDTSTGIKGTMYDSLSTILASSRLLLTLINNTLDTRKINADMMQKIELGTVSIMACIRDSFQYCGPFATINEAILELRTTNGTSLNLPQILNSSNSSSDLMSDLIKKKYNVVGNRLRLEQVIVNLLSNGIKYTTPGTSVIASVRNCSLAKVLEEVKAAPSSSLKFLSEEDLRELDESPAAEKNSDVTIFSVRDHGKGIPPNEYGKVFGEFQQLDASAEKDRKYEGGKANAGQSSGSGLGLNLAMKFVTMMKGHIWFENTTDGKGGVTFSFYLTRSRQARDPQGSSSTTAGGAVKMNESSRTDSFNSTVLSDTELQERMSCFRVLVIDDSMINLKVLARMLNKIKVQHCETALSGSEALEYLKPIRNNPDLTPNLILCDLQMPGMDGYELMGHLREMNICSSPIVMACSADWSSETESKCHDVGFDGLLRKPITVTYLKEFLGKTKLN